MGVAYGDGRGGDEIITAINLIGGLLAVGDKGDLGRGQLRRAHIDRDLAVFFHIDNGDAGAGGDADPVFVGQALVEDKAGKAADAVATLFDFAAVGVKDAVVKVHIGE